MRGSRLAALLLPLFSLSCSTAPAPPVTAPARRRPADAALPDRDRAAAPVARPDVGTAPDVRPAAVTVDEPLFVRFPAGSDRFTPDSKGLLDRMADMIKKSPPGTVVRVEGHADSAEKNAAVLSLRRARSVRRYLVSQGVDPQQVTAAGYGATRPVGDSAENRRVEFSGLDVSY